MLLGGSFMLTPAHPFISGWGAITDALGNLIGAESLGYGAFGFFPRWFLGLFG